MRRLLVGLAILAAAVPGPLAQADDREIAQQIVKHLEAHRAEGKLKQFNIGLRVENGAVFFTGNVANRGQADLAMEIARAMDGVNSVINEMSIADFEKRAQGDAQIKPASAETTPDREQPFRRVVKGAVAKPKLVAEQPAETSEAREDAPASDAQGEPATDATSIANEVIARLKKEQREGNLRGFSIDVAVEQGVLSLKGRVSTQKHLDHVLQVARRVPGVKQVLNGLKVVTEEATPVAQATAAPIQALAPSQPEAPEAEQVTEAPVVNAPRTADDIARQVVQRLRRSKDRGRLRDFGIDVHVEEGSVWLSGYVADAEQLQVALDAARYVRGVKQVVNDLDVGPEAAAADELAAAESTPTLQPIEASNVSGRVPVTPAAPNTLQQAADESVLSAAPAAPAAPAAQPGRPGVQYRWVQVPVAQAPQAGQMPLAFAPARPVSHQQGVVQAAPAPVPASVPGVGAAAARFDHPQLPGYAWPSYAAYPNYGAVTYPKQYSPSAWPYIGPFYPYPQVPLGWRKVTLEWDDGWWHLDFKDRH